jgi:hypothetical protein
VLRPEQRSRLLLGERAVGEARRGWRHTGLRGGDFVFDAGQDLSIGYDSHDSEVVRLYLEESFSFHVATADAAVALTP